MIWPFRRTTPPKPSAEAQSAVDSSARQLEEARRLRKESQQVGAALTRAHAENHFAMALASVISGGRP